MPTVWVDCLAQRVQLPSFIQQFHGHMALLHCPYVGAKGAVSVVIFQNGDEMENILWRRWLCSWCQSILWVVCETSPFGHVWLQNEYIELPSCLFVHWNHLSVGDKRWTSLISHQLACAMHTKISRQKVCLSWRQYWVVSHSRNISLQKIILQVPQLWALSMWGQFECLSPGDWWRLQCCQSPCLKAEAWWNLLLWNCIGGQEQGGDVMGQ